MSSDHDPTSPGPPTLSDAARAAYESSEELIAMRKQERDLEATERDLEKRLEMFSADVERTRQAEDAEYYKAHWNHARDVPFEDALGGGTSAAGGDGETL